jgi:Terminase large subunit, T4likevirus-type, N-terminal/Terminase RNaseH-like domain
VSEVFTLRQLPPLHTTQQLVFQDPHRFKTLFCGRRWGKTELGVDAIIRGATTTPGLYWWVGLSWRSASMKRAWRLLRQRFRGLAEIRENDHEIRIANGSEIWLRSAEGPDSLTGEGVRGVVMDEFSLMEQRIWDEHVSATLLDENGWAMFLGVPKGRNWAWQLWSRGADKAYPEWASWRFETWDNPFMPRLTPDGRDAKEVTRQEKPDLYFRQEHLAEVIDDAGTVFRRVLDAATVPAMLAGPQPGRRYILGVDWGKLNDFTVITVVDDTGAVVFIDRFNQIDYAVQKPRVVEAARRFRADMVVVESNSMGVPLIEDLQRVDPPIPVQPFVTNNASKALIIERLALAFERGEITIPRDPVLIDELQGFAQERLPGGMMRYGAPSGGHDDTVMSVAFAWYGLRGDSSRAQWQAMYEDWKAEKEEDVPESLRAIVPIAVPVEPRKQPSEQPRAGIWAVVDGMRG